ncbi:Phenylacetic acid catabolic protein [Tropicimonas sp. TH_r6]|uniref:Phenylacetic acid catabolic protein n=1 Tax=Tropicimonas sp. TH_r6 TaxID=3082085 RepID=UPI002955DE74|nr:Phenylacetic acid catabolic protein [Tropicimonas sp. TH_r6]MDV7144642.1 Phenylacetic acid catabolic protein [Tropicimonas sp. TH_r6]
MTEMSIESYLAQGGVLTSPGNAPPRYRAELMRLMASFVDSELAGAAGFADIINEGPGITERIAASRIVLEKLDHAERVLKIMGDFGADTARYANHHPWTARLSRESDIGATRTGQDMRLAVFHYPLQGWADAVVMNLLMGLAVGVQLSEYQKISYQPLAEAFRAIAPREARHAELAREGMEALAADLANLEMLRRSAAYWWPRVAASFGAESSSRADSLAAFGLRKRSNGALRTQWETEASAALAQLIGDGWR